ncbi:hypothetical protein ACFLT9_13555 [Acidobacteriota bacterium]
MKTHRYYLLVLAFVFLITSRGFTCEYNVRDSGFVNIDPRGYSLYLYADDSISEETSKEFNSYAHLQARDTNLILRIIQSGDPESAAAMEYFRFWNVKSLPALILVSPDKRSMLLYEHDRTGDRYLGLWEVLEGIVSSPVQKEILENIILSYAVVLVIEGSVPEKNLAAIKTIEEASFEISHLMKQLPKRIERPPHIISLSQEDFKQEVILLWSLDIDLQELESPQVVILYGRGRIFLSPFQGDHLSVTQLTNVLSILGLACDCGLDKRGMMGPTIPLKWDAGSQAEVVKYLGFDAENPLIKREISGILTTDNFRTSASSPGENSIKDTLRELSLYNESVQSFDRRFGENRLSPVKQRVLENSAGASKESGLKVTFLLLLGAIIFLIALITGLFILIKSRTQK